MARTQAKKKPLPDTAAIADRLHSAAIHLLRRVRKQDAATGEGPARLSALSVLVFGGPMTLGQLAAAEQVKPPTMSRIVTGLERQPAGGARWRIRKMPAGCGFAPPRAASACCMRAGGAESNIWPAISTALPEAESWRPR